MLAPTFESMLRDVGDTDILSDEPIIDFRGLLRADSLVVPVELAATASLFCYLVPRDLSIKVHLERLSDVKAAVDAEPSNVIEFWRPFYDGKIVRKGRLQRR